MNELRRHGLRSSNGTSSEAEPRRTMDVVRARKYRIPKSVYAVAAALVLAALVVAAVTTLSHTRSSAPAVDASTLVTDTARRGTLVRSVSAQGTFRPDLVRVASATQSGVVNEIFVKPGTVVQPGTVIAQMDNPALTAAVIAARSQLDVARANLASARQQASSARITQQSAITDAQAQSQLNTLQARALSKLHASGLVADVEYEKARIQAQKSVSDVAQSRAQLAVGSADSEAKIAAMQAQVVQTAAQLHADEAEVGALTVRAATAGIVQSVDVDPGTSVAQNTAIARIADIRSLKAVLQVAESDVHPVVIGMVARIDTGNGVVRGRVAHIAPAAQNGTVAVDVTFVRALPAGARPDANVDGTIEIARIPDSVSIARPAGAADGASLDVFKVVDQGRRAVRVRARLGRGSNDRVAVVSGVAPGDVVIVSDMSSYLDQPELRLR